jgi:hypothetical protein
VTPGLVAFPVSTPYYLADCLKSYPVLRSDFSQKESERSKLSDRSDLRPCQLGVRVALAFQGVLVERSEFCAIRAPFLGHVTRIVLVCSFEQMLWVAAWRVVAGVADEQGQGSSPYWSINAKRLARYIFLRILNAPYPPSLLFARSHGQHSSSPCFSTRLQNRSI